MAIFVWRAAVPLHATHLASGVILSNTQTPTSEMSAATAKALPTFAIMQLEAELEDAQLAADNAEMLVEEIIAERERAVREWMEYEEPPEEAATRVGVPLPPDVMDEFVRDIAVEIRNEWKMDIAAAIDERKKTAKRVKQLTADLAAAKAAAK